MKSTHLAHLLADTSNPPSSPNPTLVYSSIFKGSILLTQAVPSKYRLGTPTAVGELPHLLRPIPIRERRYARRTGFLPSPFRRCVRRYLLIKTADDGRPFYPVQTERLVLFVDCSSATASPRRMMTLPSMPCVVASNLIHIALLENVFCPCPSFIRVEADVAVGSCVLLKRASHEILRMVLFGTGPLLSSYHRGRRSRMLSRRRYSHARD